MASVLASFDAAPNPNRNIGAQLQPTYYSALLHAVRYLFGYDGLGMAF